MTTVELSMPECFAHYLLMNDAAALYDSELRACERELAEFDLTPAQCVSCEPLGIAKWHSLQCNMALFTFLKD